MDAPVVTLGYSAQDVLNAVASGIDESLLWTPDSGVEIQPEMGTGRISIGFEYADGEIRVIQPRSGAMAASSAALTDAGTETNCPPMLEIDVKLQVNTVGGALNEHMTATLVADGSVIAFKASMAIDDIAGSLPLVPNSGWHEVEISGVVMGVGSTGQVAVRAPTDPTEIAPGSSLEHPAEASSAPKP